MDGWMDRLIFIYLFLKTDFDECGGNNNHCHQNAACTNTLGSYKCQCSLGYTGDGITCTGIFLPIHIPSHNYRLRSFVFLKFRQRPAIFLLRALNLVVLLLCCLRIRQNDGNKRIFFASTQT